MRRIPPEKKTTFSVLGYIAETGGCGLEGEGGCAAALACNGGRRPRQNPKEGALNTAQD